MKESCLLYITVKEIYNAGRNHAYQGSNTLAVGHDIWLHFNPFCAEL